MIPSHSITSLNHFASCSDYVQVNSANLNSVDWYDRFVSEEFHTRNSFAKTPVLKSWGEKSPRWKRKKSQCNMTAKFDGTGQTKMTALKI